MTMIVATTDRYLSKVPFFDQFEKIAKARPDMIILREKDLSSKDYKSMAKTCIDISVRYDVEFCVNSFSDVAAELKVKNIQLPLELFKRDLEKMQKFDFIGVSIHSTEDAVSVERLGADYLIYGNVFESQCKPGVPAKGLDSLARICSSVDIPVYGIGGITEDNADSVIKAGAEGVCMISALMTADDPSTVVSAVKKCF
jgi:Thiamine monophosphate synthase